MKDILLLILGVMCGILLMTTFICWKGWKVSQDYIKENELMQNYWRAVTR